MDLPTSFGKQAASINVAGRYEAAARPEYLARRKNKKNGTYSSEDASGDSGDSDSDSDSDEEYDVYDELPISHELVLSQAHDKAVSTITRDSSGNRLVSGGNDAMMKLWDFSGMDPIRRRPFQVNEPIESHRVRKLCFSKDFSSILTIASSSSFKLYDRDGMEVEEFRAGDMYLTDMTNTRGHIAEVTDVVWSPVSESRFLSCSLDSTIRFWDLNKKMGKQEKVIVVKNSSSKTAGGKCKLIRCCYDPTGSQIYAIDDFGRLCRWNSKGPFIRPLDAIQDAHAAGSWTTSLDFNPVDDNYLLSRATDHSIKLWDKRSFTRPVLSRDSLKCISETTPAVFSPDGQYIITGEEEKLLVLDKSDLSTLESLDMSLSTSAVKSDRGITALNWHGKTNQIDVGLADGSIAVLLSPELSNKGAKVVLEKAPRVRHFDEGSDFGVDLTGIGSSAYENETKARTSRSKGDDQDGNSTGAKRAYPQPLSRNEILAPDTEHIKTIGGEDITQDPREALLKYAKKRKTSE